MSKTAIGYLEVITGPMYCGKTEELIRQVKRATIGKKKVQVFKHHIDNRYGKDSNLHSHAGVKFKSVIVKSAKDILAKVKKDTQIVAIDEAQWFGNELITVINQLLEQKKHIIVAGLAMTFDRQPFTPIPQLLTLADKVNKLSAVCSLCGADAVFHKRISKDMVKKNALEPHPGFVAKLDLTIFQARCRNCYSKKP